MDRKKRILKNTVSNVIIQIVQLLKGLVMLPLLLAYFGKDVFGINAYIISLAAFLSFFSFSMFMSFMKYIPEMVAKKQREEISEFICAMLLVSFILHLFAGIFLYTFPYYGLDWFNVPLKLQRLTQSIMQLVGVFTMLSFFEPIANGMLSGLQEFHLKNKIMVISIVISVLAYIVVFYTRSDLFVYNFILRMGLLLTIFIQLLYGIRILPVKLRLVMPRLGLLKQKFSFNAFILVSQVSDYLTYTVDKLILQKLFGPVMVTDYHIARRTHQLSHTFMSMPVSAVFPSLSEGFANKDRDFIRRMNSEGTLIYNFIIIPPLVTLFIFLDKFILLWLGSDYKTSVLGGRLFLLTLIFVGIFKIVRHSLVAKGRVSEIGYVKPISAVLNFIASYFLAKKMGLIGVIIPTLFYILIVNTFLNIYLVFKEDIITLKEFGVSVFPALAVSVLGCSLMFVVRSISGITSWTNLFCWGIATGILFYAVYLLLSPVWFKYRLAEYWKVLIRKIGGIW